MRWLELGSLSALMTLFITATVVAQPVSLKNEPPAITGVTLSSNEVGQYETLEIEVAIVSEYENPFDPEDIALNATFVTPSGRAVARPGFVSQRVRRGGGYLTPSNTRWLIRFSGDEIGVHRFHIQLTTRSGVTTMEGPAFTIVPSDHPGPIRVSPTNPYYFEYAASGEDFVPIGHNIGWSWSQSFPEYRQWFERLSSHGGNFTRVWMGGHGLTSRTFYLEDHNLGLGKFRLDHAADMDQLLSLADRYQLRLMVSIDSFNSLQTSATWFGEWHISPYNAQNGGPLRSPGEYWTNEDAKRYVRHKIRYIAARWGHDPTIAFWQLWNEADGATNYNQQEAAKWHREIAGYLRSLDPWNRPITSSFAQHEGTMEQIFTLSDMDFTTSHRYNSSDMAGTVSTAVKSDLTRYQKPTITDEFGIGHDQLAKDPTGIHLHNGIWSALMSGSAGSAQLWYWDNYIHPRNLYVHYRPLADFAKRFSFTDVPLVDMVRDIWVPMQVRKLGLKAATGDRAIVWLQNKWHTWASYARSAPKPPPAQDGVDVGLTGLNPGAYQVLLWDTWEGTVIDTYIVETVDERLTIPVGSILRDVALIVQRLSDSE